MKNKHKRLVIAALAVATVLTGCKQSNPADENPAVDTNSPSTNAWQKVKETTTNAWADVKEGTSNAWADAKDYWQTNDYAYDKKDAFVADAKADLDALDQKIKDWSDKVASSTDSVKADAQAKLQELRDKRSGLDQKLDDIKNATAANWNDAKAGFENAYDDTKNSVKQAWQWLKDKVNS
jgi:predicted  nucleic acid-binding Zn-ribbon protein